MHKQRIKFILLTILSVLLPQLSSAVDGNFTHVHYDDHNGMSQWHLTKVLQDSRGFMWFATWNGLNRYDGYQFAVFKSKPGDGNNLTSDRIRNMLMGEDGNIYCANNDVVWRFNLTTYQFEPIEPSLQERYLARMNYDTTVFKKAHTYTFGEFTFNDVRQYFQDSQKNFWLMGQYGVEKITAAPSSAQMLDCIPTSIVRSIFVDNKKRIWIGTRDANVVAVLDNKAQLIGYLGQDGALHKELTSFAPCYSIYQQKNGTIWMGSKPNGIYRLQEKADGTYQIDNFQKGTAAQIKSGMTLNCTDVYAFQEDKKGRLWVATQGGGINMIPNPNLPAEQIRFYSPQNVFKKFPAQSMYMRRLMLAGDSLLLASTTEGFLVISGLEGDAKNVNFTLHQRESVRASSLSCSATMDMLFDRKGRLFISTESGGVNMLLTDNLRAKQFDFKHFDADCGMGSDVALAMTEVGDEILVQCNNQVARLNADLNQIENYNDLFFSIASRFSDAEPILLADGRWLLSLETGIVLVPEQLFHHRGDVPRLVFTSFDMPGKPADYSAENKDTLVLSSSERDVTISYAALDYSNNSNIKYVTRITEEKHWWQQSDSAEWSTPQDGRSTTLYNLSPGTYTVEVRSTNAEGLWVDNTRRLTVIVTPMFWETTLACVMYVLIFILIVAGITYTVTYIKNLQKQREENLQAYLKLFETQSEAKAQAEAKAAEQQLNKTVIIGGVQTESAAEETLQARQDAETPQMIISSPIINEEDDAFMRRLLDFVDENLSNSDVGVDEMASATATSRSSLNRKMKQLLGITPADFLKEARMKHASQLLATTSKGVNEIAYSCGFSDPKYFSKCFKSTVGKSPSEYRSEAQSCAR